jgi:hypothetical protein
MVKKLNAGFEDISDFVWNDRREDLGNWYFSRVMENSSKLEIDGD